MIDLTFYNAVALCLGGVSIFVAMKILNNQRKVRIWSKWSEQSKNKVVLHGMFGGRQVPTASPFVLKVETYLRMAKIPYEIDKVDVWGPKAKTPWLSINGRNISDSQFIVEYLRKKYDKQLNAVYSEEKQAIGMAVRVMMEEYMYWGGILWRFTFGGRDTFEQLRKGNITIGEFMIFKMIAPSLTSMAWTQGLGRHSEQEVIEIMSNCLKSVSKILGNKPFLLGHHPCEEDCAVFGQLASAVFTENSPFTELFENELRNLKDYCQRMKEEYWPDWNELLHH